jgi:hypothetical protein
LRYRGEVDRDTRNGETKGNIDWFTSPVPSSWKDAMDRKEYKNMTLFNNKYEDIKPFFSLLEKISTSIIPQEVIKPNDRGLGVFSLERALMSPDAELSLWSVKHDRFFFLGEGEQVYDKNGKEIRKKVKVFGEEQDLVLFKLKEDGSEAFLTQTRSDNGTKQWGSLNKKSFLYKEKHPRPKRSVRIFVQVGGNWYQREIYWAGIGATMIAQFLMSKGYAVRITAVVITASTYSRNSMSIGNDRPFNFKGVKADGYRTHLIDVKNYDEELDTLGLLYPLADGSFFRVRCFDYFMAEQWKNSDILNTGLYYSPPFYDTQQVIEEQIKKGEIEQEKDTLYYFIGGDDVCSQEGIERNLAYIICDAEKRNAELLAQMGVSFAPPSESSINLGNVDCDEILRQVKGSSNP